MRPTRHLLFWLSSLVFVVFAPGCASTQKTFDKAVKAEEAGRYEEAASLYIEVLRKEPEWEDARARLTRTGGIVVENNLAEVARLETESRYVAAADLLARTESFHLRATAVGANLSLPDDFADRRSRLEDLAVRQLIADAGKARDAGRWGEALALYDRALGRGSLTRTEAASVRESKAEVLTRWSEQALEEGRYRFAFDKAQQALDIIGFEHTLTPRLRNVQETALEEGSAYVAILPVASTENARREASMLFLNDLNDLLVYDHWSRAPPFILVADPVNVRRDLRSIVGRSGRVVTRSEAVAVGRLANADWVVVPEVVTFQRSERRGGERTVRARTRGRNSLDTTYTVITKDLKLYARADVRIYDVLSGRERFKSYVDDSVEERFEQGRYTGDYRDLDLSGSELQLFDADEHRARQDRMEGTLADRLAGKLAERVYSRTTSWIQ